MCIVYFWIRSLNPSNLTYLTYAGVIYILWLAYQVAISRPGNDTSSKQASFWSGFMLQIVNVKIFLFGITALTGYVTPYYSSLGMLVFFEMIIATIGSIATLTWVFLGGLFQKTYIKHFRVINSILALILVQCAVGLILQ